MPRAGAKLGLPKGYVFLLLPYLSCSFVKGVLLCFSGVAHDAAGAQPTAGPASSRLSNYYNYAGASFLRCNDSGLPR